LINPQLLKTIPKATVKELLEDLAYIALDMNLSKKLYINILEKV